MASLMNSDKHKEGGTQPNSFHVATDILVPSQKDSSYTKSEKYRPVSLMNKDTKFPNRL